MERKPKQLLGRGASLCPCRMLEPARDPSSRALSCREINLTGGPGDLDFSCVTRRHEMAEGDGMVCGREAQAFVSDSLGFESLLCHILFSNLMQVILSEPDFSVA